MIHEMKADVKELFKIDRPFTVAMWDFSWIERRKEVAGRRL